MSKNRITLPKAALSRGEAAEYFEVTIENGRIVLTPGAAQRAHAMRGKLQLRGIAEQTVKDAIVWARRS